MLLSPIRRIGRAWLRGEQQGLGFRVSLSGGHACRRVRVRGRGRRP